MLKKLNTGGAETSFNDPEPQSFYRSPLINWYRLLPNLALINFPLRRQHRIVQ